MKGKSTKTALLMSFTSLLLCCAMLIGTTFAWFTDSVTSGVNKIQAGNLDIEVSYKPENSSEWVSIKDVGTLFNPNALWEPGHTEFVTLKIENKGTLALKYQMNVSPVSESGGINQAGKSFKLSDYLMFGTADATETSTYTRETARAAVTATAKGLTQQSMSKSGTMAKGADAQYITLVVYMPETVGNEANYKTGTTAPEINLGITVVATQLNNESDSFGIDYDKDAKYDPLAAVYTYNYFPQTKQVAQLKKSTGGETPVAQKDGEDKHVEDKDAKITIKSDAEIGEDKSFAEIEFGNGDIVFNEGSEKATVTFNAEKKSEGNFTVGGVDKESVTFEISAEVTGGTFKSDAIHTVKFFVGEGKQNVTLKHGNVDMTKVDKLADVDSADEFFYDKASGYITMAVDHFSEFTTECNAPVAAVGTTAYYSLKEAAEKAGDETVFVVRDTEEKDLDLSGVDLDLNGKEVKATGDSKLPEGMTKDKEGKIVACTHEQEGTPTYTMTEAGHSWTCECGEKFTEAHDELGENGACSVCGYKSDAALLAENSNYTCRIGNAGYERPFSENVTGKKDSALSAAVSGDTIKMIADYTTTNAFLASVKTKDFKLTIDLNGKAISVPSTVELNVGTYDIVDTSANGNGSINKVDLYNNQNRLNTITVNVYGGTFGTIDLDGDHGDKTLNIYGGKMGLVRVQGSGQYGHEGTPDIRDAVDKVVVNGGEIEYISFYKTVAGVLTANVPMQLTEVTGQEKIAYYGSEFMANAYKLYTVSEQTPAE